MRRRQDEHRIEAALEIDRRPFVRSTELRLDVLQLLDEVVRSPLGNEVYVFTPIGVDVDNGIALCAVAVHPFQGAVRPLQASALARRARDDVLHDAADEARRGPEREYTEIIVVRLTAADIVQRGRDFRDPTGVDHVSEVLPEIECVRVLATRATAT